MFNFVFFSLMVFFSANLFCIDAVKPKKYKVSVCAVFRNESKYLKEWVEYHQLIGIDHFYLYNNGSLDSSSNILRPYLKKGVVTLTYWPNFYQEQNDLNWIFSTQVSAYENAVKVRACKETEWLLFLDIDEFLLPVEGGKLGDILGEYDQYPAVVLSRDFFDASRVEQSQGRKLVIQSLKMVGSPLQGINKSVEKTIFKPELCEHFTWPPFKYHFKGNKKAVSLSRGQMRINNYLNRNSWNLSSGRRMQIDVRMVSELELKALLDSGYEMEDQEQVIYKFVPEMLQKMQY